MSVGSAPARDPALPPEESPKVAAADLAEVKVAKAADAGGRFKIIRSSAAPVGSSTAAATVADRMHLDGVASDALRPRLVVIDPKEGGWARFKKRTLVVFGSYVALQGAPGATARTYMSVKSLMKRFSMTEDEAKATIASKGGAEAIAKVLTERAEIVRDPQFLQFEKYGQSKLRIRGTTGDSGKIPITAPTLYHIIKKAKTLIKDPNPERQAALAGGVTESISESSTQHPFIVKVREGKMHIILIDPNIPPRTGGLAAVHKAFDIATATAVAVKVPLHTIGGAYSKERQERQELAVKREWEKLTLLHSGEKQPFLASYGGVQASISPWMDKDLHSVLFEEGHAVSTEIEMELMDKLMDNYESVLHQKDHYHRDLKPENVMIRKKTDGTYDLQIIDFGGARAVGQAEDPIHASYTINITRQLLPHTDASVMNKAIARERAAEEVAGKEKALAAFDEVSKKHDVYCLGVIMFTMFAKEYPPFSTAPDETFGRIPRPPETATEMSELLSKDGNWVKFKREHPNQARVIENMMIGSPGKRPSFEQANKALKAAKIEDARMGR